MRIITLLSDFGTKDGYVAQMKGVISQITDARLIDITHDVTPHHIREAAFLLRTTVPYFTAGSIHVAVVDPGVGTARRALFITTSKNILVGPDNGLLMPAAHLFSPFTVYEIVNKAYTNPSPSETFHGRDVFAPAAGYIARGVAFAQIGRPITDYVDLDFKQGENTGDVVTGKILYIDRFGNCITNIPVQILPKALVYSKTMALVSGDRRWDVPYVASYGFVNKGELLAAVGSSGYLEIGVNQGNAAAHLGLKEDDPVQITVH